MNYLIDEDDMELKKKRIFHGIVNYGTQAGFFAEALRKAGYEAISVTYADEYKRKIDIDISQTCNSSISIVRKYKRLKLLLSFFFKYDIFHFYFGRTLLPHNIDAPFYRIFGKKVLMEYLGTDVDLWLGLNGVDWRGRPVDRVKLVKRVKKQANQFERQLVCGPQYYEFVDNSIIVPLAIDINDYSYHPLKIKDGHVLTIMHCPTDRKAKKSDYIEAALEKLKSDGYIFEYKCVTGVTHEQLKIEYLSSDIVIDQLNQWWGTASIEAMALGRPVIAGYHPHLCHYDSRYENLPIINADIYNIYDVLKDVLDGKYNLEKLGEASRKYVERTHDVEVLTRQLIEIYESL